MIDVKKLVQLQSNVWYDELIKLFDDCIDVEIQKILEPIWDKSESQKIRDDEVSRSVMKHLKKMRTKLKRKADK